MLLDREDREAISVMGFWRWLYAGTLYRPVSRLMHRLNLHYAPPVGPPHGDNYCLQQHWCTWCGLRGDLIDVKRVRIPAVGKDGSRG